jgi:hypothetical protein
MLVKVEIAPDQVRREPRFAVDLAGMLQDGEGPDLAVRLRDLSRGGALAEAARTPPRLGKVTLARGALTVEARVAWVGRGRFGLAFEAPIRATDLFVQLSLSRGAGSGGAAPH